MPRISNPWDAYWLRSSTSQGVSILQGAAPGGPEIDEHGLALELSSETLLPLQVFKREGGRGLAMSGETYWHGAGRIGDQFGVRGGGERKLGRLLAVFPVGPAGPGEGGEDKQHDEKNEVLRFKGVDLSFSIVRARARIERGDGPGGQEKQELRGACTVETDTIRNR